MKKFISSTICILMISSCALFESPTETTSSSGGSSGGGGSGGGEATQCLGTTQAGKRCKNKTTNSNGYCYLHQPKEQNHGTK